MTSKTDVPKHLRGEGKALWTRLRADYVIDDAGGLTILRTICEAQDRIAEMRAVVDKEGAFVADRFGQKKPHPALAVERDSRMTLIAGFRALRLAPGDE